MAVHRYDQEDIAIYWDYGSCTMLSQYSSSLAKVYSTLPDTTRSTSASGAVSTYDLVKNIRAAIAPFGPIKSFRAYSDFSLTPSFGLKSTNIRSELSSSGVSLVDCPSDGRKELCTKIMLVDILINAWDHKPPYTFLIITGDRDLAYAVSTLRTRRYRVIIICPTATHLDLTAQASAQLDWSRVVLGMDNGPTDSPEPHLPPKDPPISSSFGMRRQSETTNDTHTHVQYISATNTTNTNSTLKSASKDRGGGGGGGVLAHAGMKSNTELPMADHNGPLRGRRNSLFSSYDARKYSVFGDLDRDYPVTAVGIGSFGLGDGPLFPRTRSQGGAQSRADSAPPNIQYSTNPPTPREEAFVLPSTNKGKQKDAQIYEPENIFPLIPAEFPKSVPYSGSIFEPFGSSDPFHFSKSPPPKSPRQIAEKFSGTLSMSPSSKSESLTRFSALHTEVSTAPTSADPASLADKSDLTIKPPSSKKIDSPKPAPTLTHGTVASSRQNSSETAASATGSATAEKIDEFTAKHKESKATSPIIFEAFKPVQSVSTPVPSTATAERKTPSPPTVQSKPAMPFIPPVATAVKPAPAPSPTPPKRSRANTTATSIPASRPSTPQVAPARSSTPQVAPARSSTPQVVPTRSSTPTVAPASSSTPQVVPAIYATLVQTLREERKRHPTGVTKSWLGARLVKKNPNLYQQAGVSRFGAYISKAVTAGVVVERIVEDEPGVALHPSLM
ncbi:hypothetical protein JR316_0003225 [Psilocybe cubensis]|uniref:NYN domain-containing protein n=2 Tax=Psilocybe cubensis TaxID=181762 RepID=A0A8H7Y2B0_PSICU|nr:hypothetical protein JR316_0003225 [Psilocybe cubensis]KAH9483749.1 hypothetical protein JR316_0003225 [Psilocybe cubensis]